MPFQRPILPYNNETLPNSNRYEVLSNLANQLPPTAEMLDADVNYLIDMGNVLEQQIIDVAAGNIPGSDNPLNANLFLTTDGASNLSWSLVRSNQYADLSINNNAIADEAISSRNIQPGAITNNLIAPQSITGSKIADNAITNNNIADNNISGGKILINSIGGSKIVDRSLGEAKIVLGSITAPLLAVNSVATGNIQDGAVTASKLAINSVATGNIQDGAVTASKLAVNSVATGNIQAGAITAPLLAANSVATGNIQGGAITTPLLANSCVATGNIQPAAISASKLQMAVFYGSIDSGNITTIYTQYVTGFSKLSEGNFTFSVQNLPGSTSYIPLACSVYGVGMLAANIASTAPGTFNVNVVRIATGDNQDPTNITVCVLYN